MLNFGQVLNCYLFSKAAPEPGAVPGAASIWRLFATPFAAPETAPKLRSLFPLSRNLQC
jgi:hypothetical protein